MSNELGDLMRNVSHLLSTNQECWRAAKACTLRQPFSDADHIFRNFIENELVSDSQTDPSIIDLPGAQELTSLQWIVSSAKSSLCYLFDMKNGIPDTSGVLDELLTFKSTIDDRKHTIGNIVSDLTHLNDMGELLNVYKAEVSLLKDMLHSVDGRIGNEFSGRTEEECLFTFTKLCHRQFDLESKIMLDFFPTYFGKVSIDSSPMSLEAYSPRNIRPNGGIERQLFTDTPSKYSGGEGALPARDRHSSGSMHQFIPSPASGVSLVNSKNPLWMVMQNVFPSEDLNVNNGARRKR